MFTGIIHYQGTIVDLEHTPDRDVGKITVRTPAASQLALGDSIAVNGVCLTVIDYTQEHFSADLMAETLHRTTLEQISPGSRVNIELPLTLSDRLGGHVLQGHVDTKIRLVSRQKHPRWHLLGWEVSADYAQYLVPQGSVAIDGVSLTVVSCEPASVPDLWIMTVSIIPTTLELTTLGITAIGAWANVEVDMTAKQVAWYLRNFLSHNSLPLPQTSHPAEEKA